MIIKTFKLNKLTILSILLLFMLPIKSISLIFLVIFIATSIFFIKYNLYIASFVFLLLWLNIAMSIINNGSVFIINAFLFIIFISPFILFLNSEKLLFFSNEYNIKSAIEYFLIIQIFVSFINGLYRFINRGNFDTDFGDIIAGTLRIPFTYSADASNQIFSLTMILVLFIYITLFQKKNYLLISLSIIVVFFASVNHLVLAVFLASLSSIRLKYLISVLFISIIILILYGIFQPTNLYVIVKRLDSIVNIFNGMDIESLGFKGEYISNFVRDINKNINLLLFGNGAGSYSSRASMILTGIYSNTPIISVSSFTMENSYYLWANFVLAIPDLQGSFNYPFASIFSFTAELGIFLNVSLIILFIHRLKKTRLFSLGERKFLYIFLLIISFIDNYWEYFQVYIIFIILILLIESNRRKNVIKDTSNT